MFTRHNRSQITLFPLSLLLTSLVLAPGVTAAPLDPPAQDDKAPAAAAPDWSKGALFGRVVDCTTGKPLANARVALHEKGGKIMAWAVTDDQGQYILAADSLSALQLRPSRRRGFLEKMTRGVGQVVTAPVKIATGVVKAVDPVNTTKAAVISAVSANPTPLAAQAVNTTGQALGVQAGARAREGAARSVMGERQATPKDKRKTLVPGEVFVTVTAAGYKELKDKAGTYWMEPPMPASGDGKTPATGVRAWLETARLAPVAVADRNSDVENCAVLLAEGQAQPALATPGTNVVLLVKLTTPGNVPLKTRVFAREDRKRTVIELKPKEGAPGVFAGEMPLDKDLKEGGTVITLVALHAEPVEVKLKNDKTDPLLDFAQGLDDMDADKGYEFDPRIMASENRLDVPLVIVDPKKASNGAPAVAPGAAPSATPTPPTTPAAPAPAATPTPPATPAPATPPANPTPPATPPPAPAPAAPPAAKP